MHILGPEGKQCGKTAQNIEVELPQIEHVLSENKESRAPKHGSSASTETVESPQGSPGDRRPKLDNSEELAHKLE